jgi:superfamily II DNA helicase RecQ
LDLEAIKSACTVEYKSNCCDNCTRHIENGTVRLEACDYTDEAYKFLSTVDMLLPSRFGIGVYVGCLIGSRAKSVVSKLRESVLTNELFGCGKNRNENWWKVFITQLTIEGFIRSKQIKSSSFSYSSPELTEKARNFLASSERSLMIFETAELKKLSGKTPERASKEDSKGFLDIRLLPT